MGKRAQAVERTRRRILDATRALHSEKGIAATSWDDIAARAGVGVGTVYRHFPTLDDLVPACGAIVMGDMALPDADAVQVLFRDVADPRERIALLVREAYGIFERGAPEVRAMRREGDVHPDVARGRDAVEATLEALVDVALKPLRPARGERAVVRALVDLGTWEALRDQGLGPGERVEAVASLLAARLAPG